MDKVNFSTFILAFNLLYRVGTEDGWTDLYDTMLGLHQTQWVVYVYFTSFFIVGTLVLVNLFIAVILDVFDDNKSLVEKEDQIESLFSWRDEWKRYDRKATGVIGAKDFIKTIMDCDEPAGFGRREPYQHE